MGIIPPLEINLIKQQLIEKQEPISGTRSETLPNEENTGIKFHKQQPAAIIQIKANH
jgi:hypothetical protein